ncbi:Boophilin-H2 [Liparis tanakae]|uniref:Boophilin-H2 n=1 Tax=Liparis tanakae TaxID=230148 RepID=A0A4Z2I5H2_9TELE|nr:Boophilin-H2 [Liparis tanakae]
MTEKVLFGCWFYLPAVFFLVRPGLAQNIDPAQCLASWNYNLIRMPTNIYWKSCQQDCAADPGCHMAVMSRPLKGSTECLLVNCLNQGRISTPRDPSATIRVYPKSTTKPDLCYRPMDHGQPPPLRYTYPLPLTPEQILDHNFFFYNVSSERCEGFHFRGSVSNGNIFSTVKQCQSLCGGVKGRRCYDFKDMTSFISCQTGSPRFFYNRTSYRCERFFDGCGSTDNSFHSQDGCGALCSEKCKIPL